MTKKENRIVSFDLMRVVLAIMVIALHFNNSSGGHGLIYAKSNKYMYEILLVIESLSVCAVNCFMMLSGFFSASNKSCCIRKPIFLLGAVSCYNILFYCMNSFLNSDFSCSVLIRTALPINYFIWLYCTVYMLSPWINLCLDQLNKKQFLLLLYVLLCLFAVWPTIIGIYSGITGTVIQQISTISSTDHGSGYTLVQFMVAYVFGVYLRKYPIQHSKRWCLGIYFSCVFAIYVLIHFTMAAIEYCNFFVVMSAFFLTAIFSKIEIKENLLIKVLASLSFNVYLVHCLIFELWEKLPIENLGQVSIEKGILLVIGSIFLMYMVSVVISMITKKLMAPVKRLLSKFLMWEYTV